MGSKGSNKTTSTTAPDPRAAAAYRSLLDRAEGVAALPYTPYTGELVADVNEQQNLGIAGINQAAGQAQPAINQALGMATQAAQPISTQDIQRYINPYIGNVVNATWDQFNNQNKIQQQQVVGNTIAQGALGGNRSAVAQAQTAGQQALAQAPVIAGLYSHGYDTAVDTARSQQQALAQGAQSVGNLGLAGQTAALTGAGAQIGAGTLQQQTQQAKDSAAYQQFVNQQAFPYQQTQWLAGIETGVGSQLGGKSETTTPAPNPWSQLLGVGLTAASAFSDKDVKENIQKIGKLNDGQNLYRFNYKGDDATRIGLIAQDVEKHHPEAVGSYDGIKIVDYDLATRQASAKRDSGGRIIGLDTGGIAASPWATAAGYIPSIGISAGRGAPEPPKPAEDQGQGMPSGQQAKDYIDAGDKLKGKLSSLGSAGTPMDLGSSWSPSPAGTFFPSLSGAGSSVGFLGGLYARGGRIGETEIDDPNSTYNRGILDEALSMEKVDNPGSPYNRGILNEARSMEEVDSPDSEYNKSLLSSSAPPGLEAAKPVWMPRIGSPSANATANIEARSGQFDPVGAGRIVPGGIAAASVLPPQNPNFLEAPTSGMPLNQLAMTPGVGSFVSQEKPPVPTALAGVSPNVAPSVISAVPGVKAGIPHPGVVPAARAGADYASWPAMEAWKRAVSSIESGSPEGDYSAVTTTKNKKGQTQRAIGRFQVMEDNVGDWTQQAIGQRMTPAEFLKSKWAQDQVFAHRFGGYVAKYGNPEEAAAAWFAGERGMGNLNARDPLGTTVASYRDKFNTALNKVSGSAMPSGEGASLAMARDDGSQLPENAAPAAGGQFSGLGWSGSTESKKPKSDDEETGGLLGALGIKMSPAVRMGLMSAGLGMMASKSPYFGTALGEGGQQGLAAYQQERQRQAQIPKIEAETRRLDAEAAKAQAEIKKLAVETEGQQYLLEGRKNLINQPWLTGKPYQTPTAAPAAVPAPVRTAAPAAVAIAPTPPPAAAPPPTPTAAPQAAEQPPVVPPQAMNMEEVAPAVASVQQTPQGPVAVDAGGQPLFNLAEEYQKAKAMQLYGATYGMNDIAQAGTQNMKIIDTILNKGHQITTSGGVMPVQGAAESEARAAAMKTGAERAAGSAYNLKEVQPVPGGPTQYMTEAEILRGGPKPGPGSPPGSVVAKQPAFIEHGQEAVMKDVEAMSGQYRTRQIVRERLGAIQEIMKKYETGHFAEAKANLVAMARSLGIPAPNLETANPELFQEFVKNMTANIFAQVKDIGGRVLVSEIEGLAKANANPELQPGANRAIVGQALGLINYEDKYFNDFTRWYRDHPYSTQADRTAFDAAWVKSNSLHAFTKEAEMNTPAKGEEIPDPKDRPVGRVYMTPKGPARWNGSAWEKVQ